MKGYNHLFLNTKTTRAANLPVGKICLTPCYSAVFIQKSGEAAYLFIRLYGDLVI